MADEKVTFEKAVAARAMLVAAARRLFGANEPLDDRSDLEIKILVIKRCAPDLEIEGVDPAFIEASYQTLLATFPQLTEDAIRADQERAVHAARQAMIEREKAHFQKGR